MNDQLTSDTTYESQQQATKYTQIVENMKRKVRKGLTSIGIVVSSMGPATTSTTSMIPMSINISAITPIASPAARAVTLLAAAKLLSACDGEDGHGGSSEIEDPAPKIEVKMRDVDISGGKIISIRGNQLYIGDSEVASRTDNKTENCRVSLFIGGMPIQSGNKVDKIGLLELRVSDENGNTTKVYINLYEIEESKVSGLDNIKNLNLKVDQEVDLLNGVTFKNGTSLNKVEIEMEGQRTVIEDPYHYKPEYPGVCSVIITVNENGNITEYRVDNLTIKALEYKPLKIKSIQAEEILPIISKVKIGDKDAYEHIKDLGIAELTRIRDMMQEYGAVGYSAEQYKKLIKNRLKIGMTMETPSGSDNYEIIGGNVRTPGGTEHATDEYFLVNSLLNLKDIGFYVVDPSGGRCWDELHEFAKNNPNSICIFGNSAHFDVDKGTFESWGQDNEKVKKLSEENNVLIIVAAGNIEVKGGITINQICHENVDGDEHCSYSLPSNANGKNDSNINRHIIVSVGTNSEGNVNQTYTQTGSSKFPYLFNDAVLYSGRAFPRLRSSTGEIVAETGKYSTSLPNYLNVAMMGLIFQMDPEISDVDELLNKVKSTALTNYIRFDFNGDGDTDDIDHRGQKETQDLQLINPAGFFKKYKFPNLQSSIQISDEISDLDKGFYKGIIFNFPGAEAEVELEIDGEMKRVWVPCDDAFDSIIKSQNPMSLNWRVNPDLLKKYGYKKGDKVQGKISIVDDDLNEMSALSEDVSFIIQ